MEKTLLETALEYRNEYQWSVIPNRNKAPVVKWSVYQTRLPTEAELRAWFEGKTWDQYGISVVTGKISNLVVVDVDIKNDTSYDGESNNVVRSGGGGTHLYYKYPDFGTINCITRVAGQPVDVKGQGGVIVLPPTLHPMTKNPYAWVKKDLENMMDLPDRMQTAIRQHVVNAKRAMAKVSAFDELDEVSEGNRNEWLSKRAYYLVMHGVRKSYLELCILAINAALPEPLGREEVHNIINYALRKGPIDESP